LSILFYLFLNDELNTFSNDEAKQDSHDIGMKTAKDPEQQIKEPIFAKGLLEAPTDNLPVIAGKVIYKDGKAAAGALVYCMVNPLETGPRPAIYEFLDNSKYVVKTKYNGSYSIIVRPDFRYYLMAAQDGYLPVVFPSSPGQSLTVVLLASAGRVSGHIIDEADGHAVVGATISLRYASRLFDSEMFTKSDIDGKYELEMVPELIELFTVDAENYESLSLSRIPITYINERAIHMAKAKTILVGIRLYNNNDGSVISRAKINNVDTHADEQGVCWIHHALGSRVIEVNAAGYCKKEVLTELLEENNIYELQMIPGGTCYGHIVDKLGKAITSVLVEPMFCKTEGTVQKIQNVVDASSSGSDGGFTLYNLPIGCIFDLRLRKENGHSEVVSKVVCEYDGMYLGKYYYGLTGRIVGEVVDEDGIGVPGAWVMVSQSIESISRALTDEKGKFKLEVSSFNDFFVSKRGYSKYRESYENGNKIVLNDGEECFRRIVLQRAEYISGTVVDCEGKGVPGAIVSISAKSRRVESDLVSDMLNTDDLGKFVLHGVTNGCEYYVKAFRDRIPSEMFYKEGELHKAGERNIVVEVTETGIIYGEICDVNGELIKGSRLLHGSKVEVCLERGLIKDLSRGSGRLTRSGYYSFTAEPGVYSLFVKSDNYLFDLEVVQLAARDEIRRDLILKQR